MLSDKPPPPDNPDAGGDLIPKVVPPLPRENPHARDLPWRRAETSPWGVMVSEFMLQQTPVNRVLPAYERWMLTWPAPADRNRQHLR